MKKYVAVAAGIVMHLCLGGVYAWSAFVPALQAAYGYGAAQTQLVFGCTVGVLTLSMLFTGRLQDRFGPRPLGMAAGLLLTASYLLVSHFADRFHWLWFAYSGVGGLAIGCGYVLPIATGVKWFPRHKGLISGLAVAGYGGGAVLLSLIGQHLLERQWTLPDIFRRVGLVYGPIVFAAGLLLFTPSRPGAPAASAGVTRLSLLRDRRFWPLAIGMFCGTLPGLMVIGAIKPIGLFYHHPERWAVAAIMVLSAGNAAGRITWGVIQDRLGGARTGRWSLATVAATMLLLMWPAPSVAWFLSAAFLLGFCFGSSLAIYPAQTADLYGEYRLGALYPMVTIFHGLAAVVGPFIMGRAFDLTGSYMPGFVFAAAVALAGWWAFAKLTPVR